MKKSVLTILVLFMAQFYVFSQNDLTNFEQKLGVQTQQFTSGVSENFDSLMLDSAITEYKNSLNIPGLATLIIKDKQIIWDKNYGYRNLEQQLPVNDSTLFLVASISKTIVATSIMQLWENKMIVLENDINDYLPAGMIIRNPNFPDDPITVKMLMTHTSSILDNWSILNLVDNCGDSPIDLYSFLASYLRVGGSRYNINNYATYSPGSNYSYTNVGVSLLALMVENLTGKSFDEYCRDSIFIPLKMNSTSWFLEGMNIDNIAIPYKNSLSPNCHFGMAFYPSASLRTTTNELSHFLMAYLNNGFYDNFSLLDSATITYMLSDQIGNFVENDTREQGLIWLRLLVLDGNMWGHGGTWDGATTWMGFDLDEKYGIIIFQNVLNIDGAIDVVNYSYGYTRCFGNIYALKSSINKSYAKTNADSILFRTKFSNINNHQFIPYLIYTDSNKTEIDSISLFDDGLHGDSLSNDGIYGGFIPPLHTENFFYLGVSTVDNLNSKYFYTPDIMKFTTIGPIKVDSLAVTKLSSNYYRIKPYLKNEGGTYTVKNIGINITTNDNSITNITSILQDISSIAPGETIGPANNLYVTVDSTFNGEFNFTFEISSNGWTYWMDTVRTIVTGISDKYVQPITYKLEQNYPNPLNPSTTIRYSIPKTSLVTLKVSYVNIN